MGFRSERKTVLLILLGAALLITAGIAAAEVLLLLRPAAHGPVAPVIVEIPHGATATSVAGILHSRGLIRNGLFFRLLAGYKGLDGKLRAGEYEVSPAMSMMEILQRLVSGPILTHPFTIREGLTVEQTAAALASQGIVSADSFLRAARDPSVAESVAPAGVDLKEPLEGYLFPETYRIRKGATDAEIVSMMVRRFREVFSPELEARAAELGMTIHQVVTMASVIEKEAAVDSERAIISGVFHNRLRIGMRLDADPTVRYALGKFSGPVTTADTKVSSPYNTYKFAGLPPGPIAAPGAASIRAALYPADTKYLYFVAKNDGTHHFSLNLRDHINAVNKYKPYGKK